MGCSRARCSRALLRELLLSPDVRGALFDGAVAFAGALPGLRLQVAPAAGAAHGPQQESRDAQADDDRRNGPRIFLGGVVSASHAFHRALTRHFVGVHRLVRQIVELLSHGTPPVSDTRVRSKARAPVTAPKFRASSRRAPAPADYGVARLAAAAPASR